MGLPKEAVKEIVGGHRSNCRRAIRLLLDRGELEERDDGRLRLPRGSSFLLLPAIPKEPVDPEYAHEVLERYGELGVVA